MITISDSIATIKLIDGSKVYNIPKEGLTLESFGTSIIFTDRFDKVYSYNYAAFSNGFASAEDARIYLESLLQTSAEITVSGDVSVSNLTYLLDKDNGTFDAFYRQRFTQPETLFDSKQIADKQPLFWDDQEVIGSGTSSTYNTNQAQTTLAVSSLTAGTRIRQTFRRFNYQPGKSHLFIQTGVWGAGGTGIVKRAGLLDAQNGVFFEQNSTGMNIGIRTFTSGSAVDTLVNQSDWNIDKLNGTGASGIILDFTKTLIWFADFEWLGVGTVRYGFFVNGRPYYCHAVNNSNINTVVYMSNPNLPLRYEISNNGTGGVNSFKHICSTVIAEGGLKDTGYPFGVTRGSNPLTTNNNANIYPLISMRLNSNYLFSSIKILDFTINCTSTASYNYYLLLNPTVTGPALSFAQVTNSSIDVDVSTTNATTVSGGTTLFVGTAIQTNNSSAVQGILNSDFSFGSTIAGVSDILVLAVQRVTGTTETFYGSINWKDQQ